jgi:hypothetical protein
MQTILRKVNNRFNHSIHLRRLHRHTQPNTNPHLQPPVNHIKQPKALKLSTHNTPNPAKPLNMYLTFNPLKRRSMRRTLNQPKLHNIRNTLQLDRQHHTRIPKAVKPINIHNTPKIRTKIQMRSKSSSRCRRRASPKNQIP